MSLIIKREDATPLHILSNLNGQTTDKSTGKESQGV
jgi:hypothetical protein